MTSHPPERTPPEPGPGTDTAAGADPGVGPGGRRGWSPRRVDALVVLAAALVGVANSWVKPSNGLMTGAPIAAVATFSGLVAVLLWWRRQAPRTVAAALLVAHIVAFTPTALAVAMYTVGAQCHHQPRTLWGFGLAGCAADLVAIQGEGPAWNLRETAYSLAAVIGPLIVGYAVALRRDLAAAARTELVMVERWHELLVEQARETERRRIAREMHDVVSHRVGHMVVAAGALEVAHTTDPDKVTATAQTIRTEGRRALEELRGLLGVLNPDRAHRGSGAPRAPQPDVAAILELVDRARQAEHEVTYTVTGHPEQLPTVVQQALYRTVQEGLTNTVKHAPGAPVTVTLDHTTHRVTATVTNGPHTGPPRHDLPSGGNGLLGLRERAALLGGTIHTGPTREGGYQLTLHLPAHPGSTGDTPAGGTGH